MASVVVECCARISSLMYVVCILVVGDRPNGERRVVSVSAVCGGMGI